VRATVTGNDYFENNSKNFVFLIFLTKE